MRTTTLLAVLFALLASTPAIASPCSDDSDSSSSFDFSSSASSVEPSTPCEGPCAEYNAWRVKNLPAVVLDLGVVTRTFTSPLGTRTASVTHESETFAYRVAQPSSPDASRETGVAAQLRLAAPLRGGFYAGAELELGGVSGSAVHSEMMDPGGRVAPTLTPGSVVMFGGAGVVGVGGRLASVFDVGVEVAGGVRGVTYGFDSHYGACETSTSITAVQGVAEARARGTAWFSPRMNLTLFGGRSLIDDGLVGGLSLGFSNQPYARR